MSHCCLTVLMLWIELCKPKQMVKIWGMPKSYQWGKFRGFWTTLDPKAPQCAVSLKSPEGQLESVYKPGSQQCQRINFFKLLHCWWKKKLRHQIKGMWRGDKGTSPQNLECSLHFQLNQNFYTADESRLAETSELC